MMQHQVIYRQAEQYASFPHLALDQNGDLLLVFREAGSETAAAALREEHSHQDLDARIRFMRSADGGRTWSESNIIQAGDPQTGITPSDPAITVLRDGRYLVRYAQWRLMPISRRAELDGLIHRHFVRRGQAGQIYGDGFSISADQGRTWAAIDVKYKTHLSGFASREAVIQLSDDSLILPVYAGYPSGAEQAWLLRSWDGGQTWEDASLIASDPNPAAQYRQGANYNETALAVLDATTLLALLRVDRNFHTEDAAQSFMSEGGSGGLEYSVSYDVGLTWEKPRSTDIFGQPAHLLRLKDGRLLATYGHRRQPYGVRVALARFASQKGWMTKAQAILRDDAAGWDVGYPASVQLPDGSIYSVYYLHEADGLRYISGTHWDLSLFD